MKHYKSLSELHKDNGWDAPLHPLFSLVSCQSSCPLGNREFTSDVYMIDFKKIQSGHILYGRTSYDHKNGSMFFTKPRQIIEMKNLEFEEDALMILIHEDFLNGTELLNVIKNYGFFDYETNEAIHLSPREEKTIWSLYDKISTEYLTNPDEFTREIILSHVASVLKYAQRFYKRQFIDRKPMASKTVTKFNAVLKEYRENGKLVSQGLPSVGYMAKILNLSSRYLSDLLKYESGKTAIELIHLFLISEAKNLLLGTDKNIAEIGYDLGFENTSYFIKLFKKESGMRPLEFKKSSLN